MKKAFAWLEGNGIAYTLHDYKKLGAPEEKLKAWIASALPSADSASSTRSRVRARSDCSAGTRASSASRRAGTTLACEMESARSARPSRTAANSRSVPGRTTSRSVLFY